MKLKHIKEYRNITLPTERSTRASNVSGNTRQISGYASVFNQASRLMWDYVGGQPTVFYEIILPGAFDDVLADVNNLDVTYNIDHDDSKLIGRTGSNLSLSVDNFGLRFVCDPVVDSTIANDLYTNISAGLYRENSFCFACDPDAESWEERSDGIYRIISKIAGLYDVSTVVRAAYQNTTISLRGQEFLEKRKINQKVEKNERDRINLEILLMSK